MLDTAFDILLDALRDCAPMLWMLFPVYTLVEYLEHSGRLARAATPWFGGRLGAFAGAALGLIPQCGMSVLMTSFFIRRRITSGTLVATFISTSDEALPVLLASGVSHLRFAGALLAIKFAAGCFWGLAIDAVSRSRITGKGAPAIVLLPSAHAAPARWPALIRHAARHTLRTTAWVYVVTAAIGLALALGPHALAAGAWTPRPALQIVPAALVGMIPNCAVSVAIVELHLHGQLALPATIAGLSAGAGFGPIVLVKDGNRRDALRVLSLTLGAAIATGLMLQVIGRW